MKGSTIKGEGGFCVGGFVKECSVRGCHEGEFRERGYHEGGAVKEGDAMKGVHEGDAVKEGVP